jgi:hypothetical protein
VTIWRNFTQTASLLAGTVFTAVVNGVLADHVRWMRLRGMSPHTVRLRMTAVGLLGMVEP